MRLAAVIFASACLCRAADPVAGRWQGAIQIPGKEVPLVVDLAPARDGGWTGSLILPGFEIKGAPLVDLSVKDSAVAFALKDTFGGPKFTAHLNADGSLAGDLMQSGNTAPFVLRKTGPPQVDHPRASTPVRAELLGEWRGDFDMPMGKVHARLTLIHQPAATAAQFAFGMRKETDAPVDFVSQDGDWLTVSAHQMGIAFEGRFRADANEIVGSFIEGGFEMPLVLHRFTGANAHP